MHRTQISLEPEQHRRLSEEARRTGISMSALIRQLIDAYFDRTEPETDDPLESIVGIGSGTGEPVSHTHDRYLYSKKIP